MKLLENAKIEWPTAQTPRSSSFDDIYFSKDYGLEESEYVFLQANHLEERFNTLQQKHFIIAETGFGTGLNFLLAADLFCQSAATDKQLYFISTEKYPLNKADLIQALANWPTLSPISQQLITQYPAAIESQALIKIEHKDIKIHLLLLLGDSQKGLDRLLENQHPLLKYAKKRAVDAWFLDGFAPSKNSSMWQNELFQSIAKLSKHGTTLTTFTAAGFVKRALHSVGFQTKKQKGFGKKREMLTATYKGLPEALQDTTVTSRYKKHSVFWPIHRQQQNTNEVIIIGAGIAGCSTAKTLAEAGINVLLIDKQIKPMQEASGNPQAVLFPKLSVNESTFANFNYTSFIYAAHYYQQSLFNNAFNQCGLLQLIQKNEEGLSKKLQQHFVNNADFLTLLPANAAGKLANTNIKQPCLHYPKAGFIDTQMLAKTIIQHSKITYQQADIQSIKKQDHKWLAKSSTQSYTADAVILCNSESSKSLLGDNQIFNTRSIRGQISHFKSQSFDKIKTVICHDGYINPPVDDADYFCGATFELNDNNPYATERSREKNIEQLKQFLPNFNTDNHDTALKHDRVNFRCATNDYMPIVGPVPNIEIFKKDYALMEKNAKAHIPIAGSFQQGLFINIAYGSRGFSSAPLCAELIKSYLLQTPFPMPFSQIKALHPARFLINQIAKKNANS